MAVAQGLRTATIASDVPATPAGPESRIPETPDWAQAKVSDLSKNLTNAAHGLEVYNDYYDGRHPLIFASEKFQEAFGGLFKAFADNWCGLVVDAVEERLNVEGFRLGDADKGDRDAWKLWQTNQMDAESQMGHVEALVCGRSAAIVWPDEDGQPVISVESADEVWIETEPGNRRNRTAALKVFCGPDGNTWATLYTPKNLWKFQRGKSSTGAWTRRETKGETWPLVNKLGVVPVVPLINRPRLRDSSSAPSWNNNDLAPWSGPGVSEIKNVLPQQDAVNKLLADMLVASEYAAYRQRYVTGLDVVIDPVTKQQLPPFKRDGPGTLFQTENPNAKFGEFDVSDLSNYVSGIQLVVQHIASQTRTPPHYFYLSGQFPSGESIKSAETGLVAKTTRKMRHFGEAWEEVIRLCFLVLGDKRADEVTSETIWRDPESRTESEHVDATLKKQALGVPQQQLWEDLGYTPAQIARFKQMQQEEAATAAASNLIGLLTAPPAGGPPPVPANAQQPDTGNPKSVTFAQDSKFAPPAA